MNVPVSTPSRNRGHIFSCFLRLFIFSLFAAALPINLLNAQTVAYVVTGNNVSVIDTSTNTVTATIPVGHSPIGVVFSPDGTRAYVTNGADDTVSVIDTGANAVVATISLGNLANNGAPAFPAITPDGKSLYVPDSVNQIVQVVSTATNSVVATIPVPNPNAVAITPDGAQAYVQNFETVVNGLTVIDTATNTVTAVISGVPSESSFGIAAAPNDASVYVTGGFVPSVSVISTSSNTLATDIPFVAPSFSQGFAEGIVFTPDGSKAYFNFEELNGAGLVFVIDTNTNTVEPAPISVGSTPELLAVTPDGAFVYVTNAGDGTVSVIATSTNTVVATVPVGPNPFGIAIANLSTPFAVFVLDNLNISNNLHADGVFLLGANTGGLDLANQPLTLTVNNFSLTIPAGSFKQVGGNMHFVFDGDVNGLAVNFKLKAVNKSNTEFTFEVDVHDVSIAGPNPANVGLRIGRNSGTTTAPF